jgi:hypothetical protein
LSRRVAVLIATAGMTVVMVALAGMALAAVIACTGGRCEGTNDPEEITARTSAVEQKRGSALREAYEKCPY